MKWIGYGLQGIGGVIAIAGMGVFAVGKLVERAAVGHEADASDQETEERVAKVG